MTQTEKIGTRLRRHQLRTFRVSVDLNKRVMQHLAVLEDIIVREIASANIMAPARISDKMRRLEVLAETIGKTGRAEFRKVDRVVQKTLAEVAEVDAIAQSAAVAAATDLTINALPGKLLNKVAGEALIEGAPSGAWWAKQDSDLMWTFKRQMRAGIKNGENTQQLINRIRGTRANGYRDGIMQTERYKAEALARTSMLSVNNSVRHEQMQRNKEVLAGWQWSATFDRATCEQCMALSGAAFDFNGDPLPGSPYTGTIDVPHPPIHFNCRCILLPVMKDEPVPDDVNFETWLKSEPESVQIEALGRGRYELWKSGQISVVDLVDQRGHPMTVRELSAATAKEAA